MTEPTRVAADSSLFTFLHSLFSKCQIARIIFENFLEKAFRLHFVQDMYFLVSTNKLKDISFLLFYELETRLLASLVFGINSGSKRMVQVRRCN